MCPRPESPWRRAEASPHGHALFNLNGYWRRPEWARSVQKSAFDDLTFFADVAHGLPGRVRDLACDPSISGRISAATDEGVFVSTTGGE